MRAPNNSIVAVLLLSLSACGCSTGPVRETPVQENETLYYLECVNSRRMKMPVRAPVRVHRDTFNGQEVVHQYQYCLEV